MFGAYGSDSEDSRSNWRERLATDWRTVRGAATLLLAGGVLVGCSDDPTGPEDPVDAEEVGVVVNSVEQTLTVFSVDDEEDASTVDLAPDGTPVDLSARGDRAVVPLGTLNAVAIVDLRDRVRLETVSLPDGSGASGSAFLGDTEALVANPNLDTVSRIDLAEGAVVDEVSVGRYPEGLLVHEGRVFVANAMLDENFVPSEEGTVTVLNAGDLSEEATVELSGLNPGDVAVGPDDRLYVLNSGQFGEGNGTVSVVDPASLEEVEHHDGFGNFPGSLAFGPDGNLYVGAFAYGVAVWDPETATFLRGPEDAVEPGGFASTAGVAFDSQGRFHAVVPEVPRNGNNEAQDPGAVMRLDAGTYDLELEIPTGVSSVGLAFSEFEDR